MIVEITGTIVVETDKAILFDIQNQEYWIPLSQCWKITRTSTVGEDKLEVESWILDKKGIEY